MLMQHCAVSLQMKFLNRDSEKSLGSMRILYQPKESFVIIYQLIRIDLQEKFGCNNRENFKVRLCCMPREAISR